MKLHRYKKYVQAGITAFLVIACSLLFYYLLFHQSSVKLALHHVLTVFSPLVAALVIAYVLSQIINFAERKIIAPLYAARKKEMTPKQRKITRALLIVLTYIAVLVSIYGLVATLIPELISSILNIVANFSQYLGNVQEYVTRLLYRYPDLQQTADQYLAEFSAKLSTWMTTDLIPNLRDVLLNLSGQLVNMVSFLKNIVLGAIVAIYLLYHKEKYVAKCKRAIYSLFGLEHGNALLHDCQYINQEFSGFLIGKVIDSLIIGVLCYLITNLIGTPYALLVSVLIGITNIIPFFGPFLGAIPSLILILLINPLQALYFLIFVVLLQQFDGNFLGPRILGETTGVSSFLVIVSILIGGGFWGIFGMIIAVPVCAILCTIFRNYSERRLKEQDLPNDVDFYLKLDHIDPETKAPVRSEKKEIREEDLFRFPKKRILQPLHLWQEESGEESQGQPEQPKEADHTEKSKKESKKGEHPEEAVSQTSEKKEDHISG